MRKIPISTTGHQDESQTHSSWIQRQYSSTVPTNSTNPIQKAVNSHTVLHWGRNPIWCGCPVTINIYGRQSQEQASCHIPSYSNEFPVGFDHVAHVLWHYATMETAFEGMSIIPRGNNATHHETHAVIISLVQHCLFMQNSNVWVDFLTPGSLISDNVNVTNVTKFNRSPCPLGIFYYENVMRNGISGQCRWCSGLDSWKISHVLTACRTQFISHWQRVET